MSPAPPKEVGSAAPMPGGWSKWAVLAASVVAVHGFFLCWPETLFYVGVSQFGVRFLDLFAILASNDALTRGLDPFAPNPLDYFNRPHVYPRPWLLLGNFGLTRADNAWLGWTLVSVFLAVVVGTLRPRSWAEVGWYGAIAAAPPVIFAVNRANNDLVVFVVLAGLVPCVLHRQPGVRLLAAGLVGAAAALKFYPAIAAAVAVDGREATEVRLRAAVIALALTVVGVGVWTDVANFNRIGPQPEGLLTLGAAHLLGEAGIQGRTATLIAGAVLIAAGVIGWRAAERVRAWVGNAPRRDWLLFVLGAVLLVGCFVTARSYAYRWVFAVWLAPLLWRVQRDAAVPCTGQRWATVWSALLLVLLWFDPLLSFVGGLYSSAETSRWLDRLFVAEQFLAWAFFLGLSVVIGAFMRSVVETLRGRGAGASASVSPGPAVSVRAP